MDPVRPVGTLGLWHCTETEKQILPRASGCEHVRAAALTRGWRGTTAVGRELQRGSRGVHCSLSNSRESTDRQVGDRQVTPVSVDPPL